jgi:hypothetical protein
MAQILVKDAYRTFSEFGNSKIFLKKGQKFHCELFRKRKYSLFTSLQYEESLHAAY